MTPRRRRRRAGRGPWRDPDLDVLGWEQGAAFAMDDLGLAILANLDLGPGSRAHHVQGGLDALASKLEGGP